MAFVYTRTYSLNYYYYNLVVCIYQMNPAIKLLAVCRNFHTVKDPCGTNKAGIQVFFA